VSFERLDAAGSLQWPCNDDAPDGTPTMHVGGFVRGKGRFMITEFVPSDERTSRFFPLVLTTGRILSQYNVGAQTRRTENVAWHPEDLLEIHPHDAEQRGIKTWFRWPAAWGQPPCEPSSPSVCPRAWSIPPSTTRKPGPTW
jgi:formate dehydrogenase major subunit